MSPWLLLLVSLAYVATGVDQMKVHWAWLGFWTSYASANVFYLIAMAK